MYERHGPALFSVEAGASGVSPAVSSVGRPPKGWVAPRGVLLAFGGEEGPLGPKRRGQLIGVVRSGARWCTYKELCPRIATISEESPDRWGSSAGMVLVLEYQERVHSLLRGWLARRHQGPVARGGGGPMQA